MKFKDIVKFPKATYEVSVLWPHLENHIEAHSYNKDGIAGLDLNPDFQRAHVWTEKQQQKYVEYILKGGEVGKNLTFNCAGWGYDYRGPYVIVDGKQRLEAARKFMRNELKVFDRYFNEFEGSMGLIVFNWRVCTLETKKDILQLYLNINAGGTPHTEQELNRIKNMLKKEQQSC